MVASIAAIAALIAPITPAVAAEPALPSMLFEFEASSSYIGQPEIVSETAPDASFIFGGYPPGHPQIEAVVYGVTDTWTIQLDPPVGEQLAIGRYPDASGDSPEDARLTVSRSGSGCTPGDASAFEIHELTRDSTGAPQSMALSFRFVCDESTTFGAMVGRLRINSTIALPSLSVPHTDRAFGGIATGTSRTRPFTLEANGDLPVTVTGVAISGPSAVDFSLDDGCTATTLAPGDTCTFDITFAPSVVGDRWASLRIEHDGPVSPLVLPLVGAGLIPTTSTVTVEPDTTYTPGNLLWKGIVVPASAPTGLGGTAELVLDGEVIPGGLDPGGVMVVSRPRVVGSHTVQLRFLGNHPYAPSTSQVYTFVVSNQTTTTLTPGTSSVSSGTPITFTATAATASNLLTPNGTMTIRDMTAGTDLGSGVVDRANPSNSVTVTLPDGTHDIRARYTSGSYLSTSTVTHTITVASPPADTTPPTVTAPTWRFVTGTPISSGRTTVRLGWTGSDAGSGVARYELVQRIDAGPWTSVSTALTGTSLDRPLAHGHSYRFRVRAIDAAGNASGWMNGPTFRVTHYGETSSRLRYTGSWVTTRSTAFWGGQARASSSAGARATISVTGRSVEWVARKGPTRGKAQVYVNGVLKATVDLYGSTYQNQRVVWAANWSTSATRTVSLRVLGTSGRPRVELDAFVVGS